MNKKIFNKWKWKVLLALMIFLWFGTVACPSTTQKAYIGKRNYAGAESPYRGALDEVTVYDRTLSATEISTLYNSYQGLNFPFTQSVTSRFVVSSNGFFKIKGIGG